MAKNIDNTEKKSNAGSKPKYKDAAALQIAIDKYFMDCQPKPILDKDGHAITDKNGNVVLIDSKPYTMTGLCIALGISRQCLMRYKNSDIFGEAITRAREKVNEFAEQMLYDRNGVQGAKFTLINNFGWSDKQDVNVSSKAAIDINIKYV